MKYKSGCFNRITITALTVLLGLSLICTPAFWLEEWFNFNNPIINAVWHIYWRVYPVWISVIISFANILCAISGIQLTYKMRKKERKAFALCVFYALISLVIFVLNIITADFIFRSVVASV